MRRPAGRARPRRQNRSRSALGMAVERETRAGLFHYRARIGACGWKARNAKAKLTSETASSKSLSRAALDDNIADVLPAVDVGGVQPGGLTRLPRSIRGHPPRSVSRCFSRSERSGLVADRDDPGERGHGSSIFTAIEKRRGGAVIAPVGITPA